MAYGENIGQPWLHKGIKCAKCEVIPISGYRYKCKKRPDYDLCQACFRREIPDPKIKYLKIERSKTTGPYQIHFIECSECGVAPIKGKRYRHKTRKDSDLCEACFLRATNPSNRRAQPESDYELLEELVINSVCSKYDQVFHFDKRCDECLVSPICGPTFTSIKNPDYDLCAFCHDEKLQIDSIRLGDFVSREKPDVSAVYHLNIICCIYCGMTPIKGPAFKHRRDPNKTLCLVCYQHVPEDKQRYFTRIDLPRQVEKGGPSFVLKAKSSPQLPISAIKTQTWKPPNEASDTNDDSRTLEPKSKSESIPLEGASSTTNIDTTEGLASRGYGGRSNLKSSETDSTTTSDSNEEEGVASRGYGGRSNLKARGANSTTTSDSNEVGGVTSRGYVGRSNLKFNGTNSTTSPDPSEEGVASRGYGARSTLKFNGKSSSITPDPDEEGGVAPRRYGARSNLKFNGTNSATPPEANEGVASRGYGGRTSLTSNGTTPAATGHTPSPKITSRTAVEIKTPPPPLYTAGLRTNRAQQPPSPRHNKSPPSPQPGQPQQSALKVPSSTPSAPKQIMKVTFAEPEQQPSPAVKFSPSLQPPPEQQAELNKSSPPQSQQRVYPPPPAQTSIPQYQQRGFSQPSAAQQPAVLGPSSVYPPSSQPPSVYPPQSQSGTTLPPPQVPNYMSGAAPNFPASAADYLAAMTAAQNNSAQQTLAMLNAIRIEKERSNLALLQQIFQRTQAQSGAQQGVDYSALVGNTGVGTDYSALLNSGGGGADYATLVAAATGGGGGGGGLDPSALLSAAGGGNTDLAALLGGQNNFGGLAGVISNLGAFGLGG